MERPNFLFIMCDQLRQDYLSCYGHPALHTPNIDSIAEQGFRFTNAYCQAPLCGPSRSSFYTGRYMSSHGAMANADPLATGELTLGDYLSDLGYRTALCGKSHTSINRAGLQRLGVDLESPLASRLICGGFEPWEVYEGLNPDPLVSPDLGYNAYLRGHGFEADNPWESFVNTAQGDAAELTGWLMRNNSKPSRIPEQHSETAFITNRAIEFLGDLNPGNNWCLHLSYIKPHWPLMAPSPYHGMYSGRDILSVCRHAQEKISPHPVVDAFMQQEYSVNYSNEEIRKSLVPVYMGLIKQIDDHLGRLFHWMRQNDQWENTVIIFTSDHGDYLGDHWLGEKDLFHDMSVKIPLMIRMPGFETREEIREQYVESIDLLPTLIEMAGGQVSVEKLEGFSLLPLLYSDEEALRELVVSEIDYSDRGVRGILNIPPYQCRAWMLCDGKWKYIYYEGFPPQLFDLEADPQEFFDVADKPESRRIIDQMQDRLFDWFRGLKRRTEMPATALDAMGPELDEQQGIVIGRW